MYHFYMKPQDVKYMFSRSPTIVCIPISGSIKIVVLEILSAVFDTQGCLCFNTVDFTSKIAKCNYVKLSNERNYLIIIFIGEV
jgi:hypothetical protein